jgi:hypothetical protein
MVSLPIAAAGQQGSSAAVVLPPGSFTSTATAGADSLIQPANINRSRSPLDALLVKTIR